MRRTPLVGLLVFSVLGFSGCAGASRRMDWSTPSTVHADAAEAPAPSRFWRRPQAEAAANDKAGDLARVNRAEPPAASTKVPGDVWPEPKSDWLVRYFPHLSRFWNGNTTRNASEAEPASDVVHVSSRSRSSAASRTGRADDDVRPVDASADDDVAPRDAPTVAEKRERFAPPPVATPLLVRSRPRSLPERTGDVELDISNVDPARQRENRSGDLEAPENSNERASSSVTATSVPASAAGDAARTEPPAETSADTEPGSKSASIVNPEPEMELAQAPAPPAPNTQPPSAIPPPPPLNRTASPPPLTGEEKPAPEAPAAAKPDQTQETKPQPAPVSPAPEVPPTAPSPAPSVAPSAAAAPVSAQQSQGLVPATGQRTVSASGQAIYASPPPMAPPRPRRRFLSLFVVEEKTEPLASPQYPAATFPTSYYGPYPRPYPVVAPPQANDVKPPVASKMGKKPCILTAWFQRITSGSHGSCCTGCHHACSAPCCSGCTCHAGKNKSVGASPERTLASPQGDLGSRRSPLSEARPIGSTGPKPGDVTEEGKLFERVSFERFDKSPQT